MTYRADFDRNFPSPWDNPLGTPDDGYWEIQAIKEQATSILDEFVSSPTMPPSSPSTNNTATDKQMAFLKTLFLERRNSPDAMRIRQDSLKAYKAGEFTKALASATITEILAIRPSGEGRRCDEWR